MNKKIGVMVMTSISALLFCALVIAVSLSPLSEWGPNANKFGSTGMWAAIGMILVSYILPLMLYMLGAGFMRYIMAIFCGIGIFMIMIIIGVGLLLEFGTTSNFVLPIGIAGIIVNVIWFFVSFRSTKKTFNYSS